MDFQNQIELELYFADHFDTILYPVLADLYFQQGDLRRARKVCEIGLKHHENDSIGLYMLAQIDKSEGNLKQAEKNLERVLLYTYEHLAAAEMLCEIQTVIGRAQSKLLRSWQHVSKLDPDNQIAEDFIKKVKGGKLKKSLEPLKTNYDNKSQVSKKNKNKTSQKTVIEKSTNPLNVSTRLATFTLVAVLKNQGLFVQALDVLEILDQKGDNKKKVQQERRLIQTLIKNSREI